jgi:hypothetical protein
MTSPSIPTAVSFLDAVTGHLDNGRTSSADRPIRLAVVDPAYDPFAAYPAATPPARVTFDGESTLSGKAYAVAQGFIPRPGQRVWMVPVGTTYLISGAVSAQTPQGFWQAADGTDSGVELGGGSYFDTTEGLYLETDATVAGDLQAARLIHAARALRVPEIQYGKTTITGTGATFYVKTVVYPVAWPVGTVVTGFANIASTSGSAGSSTSFVMPRAYAETHAQMSLYVGTTDAARAAIDWANGVTVNWLALATPVTF